MAIRKNFFNKNLSNNVGSSSKQKTAKIVEKEDAPTSRALPLSNADKEEILLKSNEFAEIINLDLLTSDELEQFKNDLVTYEPRVDLYALDTRTSNKISSEVYEEYASRKADISNFASGGSTPWSGGTVTKILTVNSTVENKFNNAAELSDDDWYGLYFGSGQNEVVCTRNSNFYYDYLGSEEFITAESQRAVQTIKSVPSRRYIKTYGTSITSGFECIDNFESMSSYGSRKSTDENNWYYDPTTRHPLNVYGGENFSILLYHGDTAYQPHQNPNLSSDYTTGESDCINNRYGKNPYTFNPNPTLSSNSSDWNYWSSLSENLNPITPAVTKKVRAAMSIDFSWWPSSDSELLVYKSLMKLDAVIRNKVINPIDVAIGSTHVLFKYSSYSGTGTSGYNLRVFGVPDYDSQGNEIVGGKFGQLQIPSGLGAITKIAAGGKTNCVIKTSNKRLFAWGDNTNNQCTQANASTAAYSHVAVGYNVIIGIRESDGKLDIFGKQSQVELYKRILGPAGRDGVFKDVKICGKSVTYLLQQKPVDTNNNQIDAYPLIVFGKILSDTSFSTTLPKELMGSYVYSQLTMYLKQFSSDTQYFGDSCYITEKLFCGGFDNGKDYNTNFSQDLRFTEISEIGCGLNHFAFKNKYGEYYSIDILRPQCSGLDTREQLNNTVREQPAYTLFGRAQLGQTKPDGTLKDDYNLNLYRTRRVFGTVDPDIYIQMMDYYPKMNMYMDLASAGRNFTALLSNDYQANKRTGQIQHNIIFNGQDSGLQCTTSIPGGPWMFNHISCHGLNSFVSSGDNIYRLGYQGIQSDFNYMQDKTVLPQAFPSTTTLLNSDIPYFSPFNGESDIYSISSSRENQFSNNIPLDDIKLWLDIGTHTALAESGKVYAWGVACTNVGEGLYTPIFDYERSTFAATPFANGYVRIFGKNLNSNISDGNRDRNTFGHNQFYTFAWKNQVTDVSASIKEYSTTRVYQPPLEKIVKIGFTAYGYYVIDIRGIVRWYANSNILQSDPLFKIPNEGNSTFGDSPSGYYQYDLVTGKTHVATYDGDGVVHVWGKYEAGQQNMPDYFKLYGNCSFLYSGDYCTIGIAEGAAIGSGLDVAFIWGGIQNNIESLSGEFDCAPGNATSATSNSCDNFYSITGVDQNLDSDAIDGYRYSMYNPNQQLNLDTTDQPLIDDDNIGILNPLPPQ